MFSNLILIPISFLFFQAVNKHISSKSVPKSCTKQLTWINIFTSFIHSSITGMGSLYIFYQNPQAFDSVILAKDQSGIAHIFCVITTGYFFYDTLDMLKEAANQKGGKIDWTLLLHHSVCICCFTWATFEPLLRMYAMSALLHEVQSIFLHFRRLLNLAKINRDSFIYFIAKYLNLLTFLVFRFYVNYFMLVDTYRNASKVYGEESEYKTSLTVLGVMVNLTFIGLNLDVFNKLMKSDFSLGKKESNKAKTG